MVINNVQMLTGYDAPEFIYKSSFIKNGQIFFVGDALRH